MKSYLLQLALVISGGLGIGSAIPMPSTPIKIPPSKQAVIQAAKQAGGFQPCGCSQMAFGNNTRATATATCATGSMVLCGILQDASGRPNQNGTCQSFFGCGFGPGVNVCGYLDYRTDNIHGGAWNLQIWFPGGGSGNGGALVPSGPGQPNFTATIGPNTWTVQ